MPDSPKCLSCLDLGKVGQTYKVAGKPLFRCSDCKLTYHRDTFEPEEFLWKDDEKKWKEWKEKKSEKKSVSTKSKS